MLTRRMIPTPKLDTRHHACLLLPPSIFFFLYISAPSSATLISSPSLFPFKHLPEHLVSMAFMPNRLTLIFCLFFALSLVSGSSAWSFEQGRPRRQSPEEFLRECQARCQRRTEGQQQEVCHDRCREEYGRRREREPSGVELDEDPWAVVNQRRDPREEYRQCRQQCRSGSKGDRERLECEARCMERWREEEERGRREGDSWMNQERPGAEEAEGEGEEEEEGGQGRPYIFHSKHYVRQRHQHGQIRFLPKLTMRSPFLRGVENYRFAILEAEPETFIVPKHADADQVIVVDYGN